MKRSVWVIEYRKKNLSVGWKPTTLCENSKRAALATAKYIQNNSSYNEYRVARYVREKAKGE